MCSYMKICIVGCGNQGTGLAGLLAQEEDVEEIVLAHRDINKAKTALALVESLGQKVKLKNIRVEKADSLNSNEVARVAKGTDLIFNGIYSNCNIPLMQASLEVGAHYIDLLSNAVEGPGVPRNETIDAQLELDEKFKAAGLTAIPCLGVSPGWSSLVASNIIDQMDTVDSVITRNMDWIDSTELLAPVAPHHVFYLWLGPPHPTCMENGTLKEVDLLASEEVFEFPEPIGKQKIYTFTQDPDIVLIHRFSGKPIRYIEGKMAISMGGLEMKDVWIKAISKQTARHTGSDNMFELFGKSLMRTTDFKKLYEEGILKNGALACTVEVTGKKNGTPVRHTAYHVTTLSEAMKHIPWAGHNVYGTIGGLVLELVLMLGRGEFKKRGVIKIAELENPEFWFKKIEGRGHLLGEKIERGSCRF
jgi:saccharopine dehydrogenase-like NADP-dependent oxidoreductase